MFSYLQMTLTKAARARLNNLRLANSLKRKRLDVSDENVDPDNVVTEEIDHENQIRKVDAETQWEEQEVPENLPRNVDTSLQGRRLISLFSLATTMTKATHHAALCKRGPVNFVTTTKQGLSTRVLFNCGCGKQFVFSTDDEQVSLNSNEALAWGCEVSAIGFSSATKLLSLLDIPTPTFKTFQRRQDLLYDDLCKASNDEMLKWAKVEAEMAIANGSYVTVEGIQYPAITVIVDGGWSKRSYGHSFSSNSGVAVIIGAQTRKVIYADTRITTCYVCQKKRNLDVPIPNHKCFKNWEKSATAMESDIILAGFSSSIKMYNLVYYRFIGDGDSSVYSKVVKIYNGMEVQKIECMNHVVKNLTTRLIEVGRNQVKGNDAKKIPLDERSKIAKDLIRIRTGIKCAIIYNKKQNNHWTKLREDILNVVRHVFGEHSNCKEYFCDKTNTKHGNRYEQVLKMVCYDPILKAINRAADLSESLIYALTSNPAECFMSVAAKYTEGKRKNFGQRFLYTLRMIGAVFSYNESTFWATEAFRMIKGYFPTDMWLAQSKKGEKSRQYKPKAYKVSRPLKFPTYAHAGDWDYGSNPQQWDLPADVMEKKIEEKRIELQITTVQKIEIELATRSQADCPQWHTERQHRITASKAGRIFKLRDTTNNSAILNDIFGRTRKIKKVQEAMKYGIDNEQKAINRYEELYGLPIGSVQRCGLFIDENHGELAASPDGLIGTNGMIEVKCPQSLADASQPASAWMNVSKTSSIAMNKHNQLYLKTNHEHYYQVVMQLHITKRDWCDYFVWSEYGSVTIRVNRDASTESLWIQMQEKLLKFWTEDLAPEIVNSRFSRGHSEYYNPPKRSQIRGKKKKPDTINGKEDDMLEMADTDDPAESQDPANTTIA